ncbi:phospholipase effector Tle1 domain-containing protein [Tritonibacter scottomollicae]|uniref:phospholipase effector Tle1 domain-containing protein n=1 Tax=Tritonibacter scottomollicae TaxID=483013 RepID=UPI003BA9098C
MRRLIICCDGTWNTADQHNDGMPTPTNVAKLHSLVAAQDGQGVEQIAYYRTGVGTSGGVFRRALGGAIGLRLEDDIMSAYKFLAETYAPGDEVFLFGFSRGAYAVRSLAGMVSNVGLADLRPDHLSPYEDPWQVVKRLMERYQSRKAGAGKTALQEALLQDRPIGVVKFHDPAQVGFRFVGVWDTVGALGIPDDKGLLRLILGDPRKHGFRDTELGGNVSCARQALAMDERRKDFTPTLWTKWGAGQDVQQRWFPGVHGDVGGGYADCRLGDLTLEWMIREAQANGLGIREIAPGQLTPDAFALRHTSYLGWFRFRPTRPRAVPELLDDASSIADRISRTCFDPSVIARHRTPPPGERSYWPTHVLAPGARHTTWVSARPRWTATGLYLERGVTYDVRAEGEWLDASIPATADGARAGVYLGKLAYWLATLPEALRAALRRIKRLQKADVPFTRRVEGAPWFALIGVIANGQGASEYGSGVEDHEVHVLGREMSFTAQESGYLHLYANDAWVMYRNNAGTLRVEIARRP